MTVVVGFVGRDGAVMASDSQASEADQTKYDVPKIWTDHGLLFGYSGNTAVREPIVQHIHQGLEGFDTSQNRHMVKAMLRQLVGAVLIQEYSSYVPQPPQGQIPAPLAGSLLMIGQDDDGYWIADIDHSNVVTFHHERGFHAIGSGSAAAQLSRGLLEHYEPESRTVKHLKLIACRTVQTCIRFLDAGVGGAIQIWTLGEDGECAEVDESEMDGIEHGVGQWALLEKESLDEIMGESPSVTPEEQQTGMPMVLDDAPQVVDAQPAEAQSPSAAQ